MSNNEEPAIGYMPALDGLRAIAVLFVVAEHSLPQIAKAVGFPLLGGLGVQMFFCLSGFLVTSILQKSRAKIEKHEGQGAAGRIVSFYCRRALRIMPLYYLAILIGLLVARERVVDHFWWLVTYTTNIEITLKHEWLYKEFAHFWSLAVEWQFYMIWPLVAFFQKPGRLKIISISLIAISFILRLIAPEIGWSRLDLYVGTLTNMDSIATGCLIALLPRVTSERYIRPALYCGLFILLLCAGLLSIHHYDTMYGKSALWNVILFDALKNSGLCLISAAVIMTTLVGSNSGLSRLLTQKWLVYLGGISYGIYVYHHLFIYWVYPQIKPHLGQFGRMGDGFSLIFSILLSLLAAALSFHFFEKPLLRLKKYFPAS